MTDFRTYHEKKRGFWVEEKSSVPCILPADGLLAIFLLKDVKELMNEKYPCKASQGEIKWYFNNTYDREIAECTDGERVYANPQVLWEHYLNANNNV